MQRATSVILCRRNAQRKNYKILMVQRSKTCRFMPGEYVFPGGVKANIDERFGLNQIDVPKITGIREVFEESGLLIAIPQPKREHVVDAWRKYDHEDQFHNLITELGCVPNISKMIPYARWVTPQQEKWRYDTHFYIAPINDEFDSTSFNLHDVRETTGSQWFEPHEALELFNRKEIKLPPPTWFILKDLAITNFDHLLTRTYSMDKYIEPNIITNKTHRAVCLPGDKQHHSDKGRGTNRIIIDCNGNYEYIRDFKD
eukprot:TRINITY_DN1952_c2_g1_i1.p1 TRINITY_DN1952_c2_g1~~TRINITY_DN1952_c2_g1_i1.p1  ORF type:complete len:273 (+),score=34.52 TRINITY_DN1952_c2_g1_i1:51-821(+)